MESASAMRRTVLSSSLRNPFPSKGDVPDGETFIKSRDLLETEVHSISRVIGSR
jgi:hypothetical protein